MLRSIVLCAIAALVVSLIAADPARAERDVYHRHFTEPWADGDKDTTQEQAGIAYADYDLDEGELFVFAEAAGLGYAHAWAQMSSTPFVYEESDWVNTFTIKYRFEGIMDCTESGAMNYFSVRAELYDFDESVDEPIEKFLLTSKTNFSSDLVLDTTRVSMFKFLLEENHTYQLKLRVDAVGVAWMTEGQATVDFSEFYASPYFVEWDYLDIYHTRTDIRTYGGTERGNLNYMEKYITQNDYSDWASGLEFTVRNKEDKIHKWDITITDFTAADSDWDPDDDRRVDVSVWGNDIPHGHTVGAYIFHWLDPEHGGCDNVGGITGTTWTLGEERSQRQTKAMPDHLWELHYPVKIPGENRHTHRFVLSNLDSSAVLRVTGLAFMPSEDLHESLAELSFLDPDTLFPVGDWFDDLTVAPLTEWDTLIETEGNLVGGYIYLKYSVHDLDADNVVCHSWARHEIHPDPAGVAQRRDDPRRILLSAPTPNPTTDAIAYRVCLSEPGRIRVRLFGPSGRLVRTLINAEFAVGVHDQTHRLNALPSGIYSLRLDRGTAGEARRVVILR